MLERRRELLETAEFTAQFDEIVRHHSREVIVPVLTGLLDGIARSPQSFEKTTWNTRLARSDSFGLTIPTFVMVFQIQNEGEENEHVLLLWIQENPTVNEIIGGYLM